jgi:predicted RNA binding protein YcfA (HicA-like mRNA interferase family)
MKTREFERILESVGFWLARSNGHNVWSNGVRRVAVPHGKHINRMVARRLLKEIEYTGRVDELNYG